MERLVKLNARKSKNVELGVEENEKAARGEGARGLSRRGGRLESAAAEEEQVDL